MKKPLSAHTKDTILKHAIREFIEFGFYGARMQRIADRAGVNKAMLFYYFSSKEQIYRNVLNSVFGVVIGGLAAIGDDDVPVEYKIRQIVDVYADVLTRYPDYFKLMQYEFLSGGGNIKAVMGGTVVPFNPVDGSLYRYFKRKIRAGEIRNVDVLQLFVSVVGQVVMPFIVQPLIETVAARPGKRFDYKKFVALRREFIVTLVCEGVCTGGKR